MSPAHIQNPIKYYFCYKHYPGEDNGGKYIYEVYLDDQLLDHVYDANAYEGWVRIKIFTSDNTVTPSGKKEGRVKIIKNYNW